MGDRDDDIKMIRIGDNDYIDDEDRPMYVEYLIVPEEQLVKDYDDWKSDNSVMERFKQRMLGIVYKAGHEMTNFGTVVQCKYEKGYGVCVTVRIFSDAQIAKNYNTNWSTGKYSVKNPEDVEDLRKLRDLLISKKIRECSLRFKDRGDRKLDHVVPIEASTVAEGFVRNKTHLIAWSSNNF